MKSQAFFGLDGLLLQEAVQESNTKKALRKHIDRREKEILGELRRLPMDPTPEDLARYQALNEELLFWGRMRSDHFPPKPEPNPELEGLLY